MTRYEAMNALEDYRDYILPEDIEALNMAIIALEALDNAQNALQHVVSVGRLKGHWITDGHHIRCDQCEVYFCNTDREGDTLPQNFCPNCGADMRGEA